jgi:YihY family inner membrane protein
VNIGVLAHPKKSMDAELGDLRTALSRRGIGDPPWRETTEGDDAPRLVGELLDRGVDRLLIWGGDGTVRGCIDAVSSAPVTLAIMPAGTANLLAANLGIPTELEAALDVALSGRRRCLDVGTVNGERFSVMAGVGFDALMIRRADAGLKDKLGRLAYVAAGVGGVGRSAVDTRVEIDGETWFEGAATCVLAGNMGDVLGGIAAFPQAEPDDGRLDARPDDQRRSSVLPLRGRDDGAPPARVTRRAAAVRAGRRGSAGGAFPGAQRGARRHRRLRPATRGRPMSTANPVPETWELTGDDARQTLARVGRRRLIIDAFQRLRAADGFSHARSLAFLGILLFVEAVIAAIGISQGLGSSQLSKAISEALQSVLPGPAGSVLQEAAGQAQRAASSGHWLAIAFGTVGALVTGTTVMGQIERAVNRIYGMEADRPTVSKYRRAFLLAISAGMLAAFALVTLGLGGSLARALDLRDVVTVWSVLRWPLGVALLVVSVGLILNWAPRRHQPAWSWMSFAAAVAAALLVAVTALLNVFFGLSGTFGDTYGPLAGIIALAFWTYATSVALLLGTALAAQLEAVRSGEAAAISAVKTRASQPRPARAAGSDATRGEKR